MAALLPVDDTFETVATDRSPGQLYLRSGCAAGPTSALLVKDPPQIHFQRRACVPEDFAFELAKAFGFGDGVGAFEFGVQKPDLGNTFGNVIFAAFLNLGETFVADDVDAQERDSRRWFFQIELLAQRAQILALIPFFVRKDARPFEFMIGDGALHALDDEIDPLLNLRELFGGSHILALLVFFRLIACVNGEVGCSVRDTLLPDGPDSAARFTLGKPLVETFEESGSLASGGADSCSCSRTESMVRPCSCSSRAAKHFSSRKSPSSRCSVPMCLWVSRSASSAPYDSTRLHSWLSGRSTEVDTFSLGAVCPSICLRMDSTAASELRKRFARALSSRSRPSSKCSVSM